MEAPPTKNFQSEYNFSWLLYAIRTVSVVFIMRAIHYWSRDLFQDFPALGQAYFVVEVLVDLAAVAWMLTSSHIEEIEIRYSMREITVAYVMFFRRKLVKIPFDSMDFHWASDAGGWKVEQVIAHGLPKETLTVFSNGKKVFSMRTNDHGFDSRTLSELVSCLREIKDKKYERNL